MKDRYTLIEHSGTLIEQSYRTLFTICSHYKGFHFIALCYFDACTSNTSVSSENYLGIIGYTQKNNKRKFWEILKRIIGKFSSIIGAGLIVVHSLVTL